MKITVLTTWRSKCGVYEYTRKLYEEIAKAGNTVRILGNYGDKDVPECLPNLYDQIYRGCFGVYWWGEEPEMDCNTVIAHANWADVFHVQYQGSLYRQPDFQKIVRQVKSKKAITVHDSGRGHPNDVRTFDIKIAHREGIILPNEKPALIFPFPTDNVSPRVLSFGMGRNDYSLVKRVCNELGVDCICHDSKLDGWLSYEKLAQMIRNSDAIVLWYNEVNAVGSSAAARTALSFYRPLIVNSVGWFEDLPKLSNLYVVNNEEELKAKLSEVMNIDYMTKNSYRAAAMKTIKIFDQQT